MPNCEAVTILCSTSNQANAQQLAVPVVLNACTALPHDVKGGELEQKYDVRMLFKRDHSHQDA